MNFFDLHCDILTATSNPYKILKAIGTNVKICTAIYKGSIKEENLLNIVKKFNENNLKNAYLCFEDVGYTNISIDEIISLKPLYVQLTYNDENKYGYGCNFNYKLKNLGVDAVKKLSANDIYVDVSHLSEKGALQVLEYTNKVICSHALFNDVYFCKRNVSKTLIKNIVSVGGLVGACLYSNFIGKNNSFNAFFKHIDYFLQNFGDENLCIGSDFYGADTFVENIKNYNDISVLFSAFQSYGYKLKTIENIFYNNAIKLLKY